ncbi:MAG: hypothetical protein FH749_13015 [Firmicutes bacterium]|nr:hypothetical protein [Bacillota bacterium]
MRQFNCNRAKIDVVDGKLTVRRSEGSLLLSDGGSKPLDIRQNKDTMIVSGSHCDLEIWLPVDGTIAIDGRRLDVNFVDGVGRASVDVTDGAVKAESWSGEIAVDSSGGNVELRNVTGPISIDTGSGAVHISGCNGSAYVDTGAGSVTVNDSALSPLEVDTGSGPVILRHCRGSISVDTGSGEVVLHEVFSKKLQVDTNDGKIVASLPGGSPGRWRLQSGRGDVLLTVPENISSQFELKGKNLEIDEQLPLKSCQKFDGGARGILGDGVGLLSAGSARGRVILEYAPPQEIIEVEPEAEATSPADEETLRILNMLKQGTISAEEAGELLDALDGSDDSA